MKTLCVLLLASAMAWAQAKPSIEARLQLLEDKEEIRTLLLDYGRTLDARDLKAYSELFAKDGEWIGGFGSVKGRAELLDFMKKNVGTGPNRGNTYHLLTNFFIRIVAGDLEKQIRGLRRALLRHQEHCLASKCCRAPRCSRK